MKYLILVFYCLGVANYNNNKFILFIFLLYSTNPSTVFRNSSFNIIIKGEGLSKNT